MYNMSVLTAQSELYLLEPNSFESSDHWPLMTLTGNNHEAANLCGFHSSMDPRLLDRIPDFMKKFSTFQCGIQKASFLVKIHIFNAGSSNQGYLPEDVSPCWRPRGSSTGTRWAPGRPCLAVLQMLIPGGVVCHRGHRGRISSAWPSRTQCPDCQQHGSWRCHLVRETHTKSYDMPLMFSMKHDAYTYCNHY